MDEAQQRLQDRIGEYQRARMETAERLRGDVAPAAWPLVEHLMTLSREMGELQARYDACRAWGI